MVDRPDRISKYRLTPPASGLFSYVIFALQRGKYHFLVRLLSFPSCLRFLRGMMGAARPFTPVLRLLGVNWTLSHAHTKALLEQEDDFHVTAGLSDRLPAGSFLMDIDWRRQHAAEHTLVAAALGNEAEDQKETPELRDLRVFAAYQCARRVHENGRRRLNVARDFTEELTLDVVHEYFGLGDNSEDLREELRLIFRLLASQIFQSAPVGGEYALETLKAQDRLLEITLTRSDQTRDTVLTRLEKAAACARKDGAAWATPAWAARNAAGLAAFGSGTVARAATQIAYRLLSIRGARRAAHRAVCDYLAAPTDDNRARVRQIALEALRFNPMLPLMGLRRSTRRSELYAACPHARVRVDPGQTFIPSPFAAMFDGEVFRRPGAFRTTQRQLSAYLHFGHGRHICVGKRQAEVLLEEVVISLFRDDRLRRRGRIKYDGPAVNEFWVRFNA